MIASVIEASQVALQISSPPLPVSSKPQRQHTFLQFLTSSTMIAFVKDLRALQSALHHLLRLLPPPPNLIFSTMTAFVKEVQALHILQALLISLLHYQVGALLSTSQVQSAAAARVKAQPLVARQE